MTLFEDVPLWKRVLETEELVLKHYYLLGDCWISNFDRALQHAAKFAAKWPLCRPTL